ncbi:MAG: hypothetical protein Q8Q08_04350 [Candidatus Omnitrophota bacterium]|nr:hypothetical protein [Candidatus Omnitrophota bacterium]MDZ4242245.1 hypothetical protein [Candidatus Omnitrophota bacterium]
MAAEYQRSLLLHVNRSQQRIIFPIMVCCFIASVISFATLCYLYYIGEHLMLLAEVDIHQFHWALPWFVDIKRFNGVAPLFFISTGVLLLVLVYWTYYVSNIMVGPYERVLRELDALIAGESKGPIHARKGDEVFEALIQRINILAEKVQKG